RRSKLIAASLVLLALTCMFASSRTKSPEWAGDSLNTGFGNVKMLEADYQKWEAQYEKQGGDRHLVMPIGWLKGLSTEFSAGKGSITIDLIGGSVSANISGLPAAPGWDVWLIDNRSGKTVMPEAEDQKLLIGRLKTEGKAAKLDVKLGEHAFKDFEPDLVVVSRVGMEPTVSRALVATTTLFQ